jgi:hypothetical protein
VRGKMPLCFEIVEIIDVGMHHCGDSRIEHLPYREPAGLGVKPGDDLEPYTQPLAQVDLELGSPAPYIDGRLYAADLVEHEIDAGAQAEHHVLGVLVAVELEHVAHRRAAAVAARAVREILDQD